MIHYDMAQLKRPIQKPRSKIICGDATLCVETQTIIFLAVFDGAGHGLTAAKIAHSAITFLESHRHYELCFLMVELHKLLRGTIGGVAAICCIEKATALLTCSGIGNITTRLFTPDSFRFIPADGVLGYEILTPKMYQHQLEHNNILIIYSDGIQDHFELNACPHTFNLNAAQLCNKIMDDFSKPFDDAACIVLKVIYD